jgi:hypothetical protein
LKFGASIPIYSSFDELSRKIPRGPLGILTYPQDRDRRKILRRGKIERIEI